MTVFMAMLLGLLKGLAVFLPISEAAHEAIVYNLFGLNVPEDGLVFFNFLLNLSTLVSIMMVYHRELGALIRDGADFVKGRVVEYGDGNGRFPPTVRMIFFIFIGTLPLVLALPLNTRSALLMDNTIFVGGTMIAMGALLFASDKLIKTGRLNSKTMRSGDALVIGLAQALAVIPGLSRIGTTVTVGLARGLKKIFQSVFLFFCPCRPSSFPWR